MKLYALLQFVIFCTTIGYTSYKVGAIKLNDLFTKFDYDQFESLKNGYKRVHGLAMTLFLFSGIYAIFKAKISLKEPGLGEEIRKKVINRRVTFVFITFFCSAPIVSY